MPRFLLDTSCIVAVLCAWHEHHERALREIARRFDAGEELVVAAPALIETFAVLTRLPPPHRLSPSDSWMLLRGNFLEDTVTTAALDATAYWSLLQQAPDSGVAGGRVYDAVIIACAQAAAVDTIVTFNEQHFRMLAGPSITIVVPKPAAEASSRSNS